LKVDDSPKAIALVLVLAFLVILSGVILAFFTSVTTESSAASSYAGGASARVLADSAINLVQAQLRDATSNPSGEGSSSEVRAWASQPGMVRTFQTSGEPDKVL
jgi:Tfp pilus assembly protein PilX